MVVKKAVILAGGFGTRFLPATIGISKEMFPIVDMPILFYHLKECVQSGITECLIISTKDKKEIERFINAPKRLINRLKQSGRIDLLNEYYSVINNLKIKIIYQKSANGSGGATMLAKRWINGHAFVLFNGDDMFDCEIPIAKQLIDVFNVSNRCVCAVQQVPQELINRYGCADVLTSKNGKFLEVSNVVEKPKVEDAPSNFAIVGRHLFTSDIFNELAQISAHNNELYLTDAINNLVHKNCVAACPIKGMYCDCGNKLEFAKTNVRFMLKNKKFGTDFAEFIKETAQDL